jgi:porin
MDFMYNASGGIDQRGTALGNIDLTLEVDTEKAELWKNGTLFFYVLGNFKSNKFLTEIVGDFQTTSNIEANEALKLYEVWYEHRFSNGMISVLAGLHDYNSEFSVVEYGGLFTNSSFGIGPDISQVGPSIFPLTSLATRLKVELNENSYAMAAVYDGVPGDPDHPTHTAIHFDHGDGIFAALEAGVSNNVPDNRDYYKLALGMWLHTAEVESFDGNVDDENKGVYLIAEKAIFAENDTGEGLGAFFQLGFANDDRNQVATYWGVGINYVGLIPGRNHDITGLGVARAINGGSFMRFSKDVAGNDVEHAETAIELTYRAGVLPWLTVQPDIQYILHPSMDPSIDDVLVAGIRVEILF